MTQDKLTQQLNRNHSLQSAARQSQSGYESLYISAVMRENAEQANEYREKILACMGDYLDLVAANYELHKRLYG
jgi:hypothetical protein